MIKLFEFLELGHPIGCGGSLGHVLYEKHKRFFSLSENFREKKSPPPSRDSPHYKGDSFIMGPGCEAGIFFREKFRVGSGLSGRVGSGLSGRTRKVNTMRNYAEYGTV